MSSSRFLFTTSSSPTLWRRPFTSCSRCACSALFFSMAFAAAAAAFLKGTFGECFTAGKADAAPAAGAALGAAVACAPPAAFSASSSLSTLRCAMASDASKSSLSLVRSARSSVSAVARARHSECSVLMRAKATWRVSSSSWRRAFSASTSLCCALTSSATPSAAISWRRACMAALRFLSFSSPETTRARMACAFFAFFSIFSCICRSPSSVGIDFFVCFVLDTRLLFTASANVSARESTSSPSSRVSMASPSRAEGLGSCSKTRCRFVCSCIQWRPTLSVSARYSSSSSCTLSSRDWRSRTSLLSSSIRRRIFSFW
mmetsp:Transcript_2639/g.9366  ORF Transcript_2639/g.9366 Transcript_2639/m.9366 type:complete len:317 (-) Transcript_2639:149-1099(-)